MATWRRGGSRKVGLVGVASVGLVVLGAITLKLRSEPFFPAAGYDHDACTGAGGGGHCFSRGARAAHPAAAASLPLCAHDYFLSPPDMRRGVAFRGSGARLSAMVSKLMAGRPVHVAVVGGSVAWGQGAPSGAHFGQRFFEWIKAAWPAPTSPHRFTNAAKPGITSALYALCGDDLIPQDADIVVLEFAFNDYYAGLNITGPERRAYERVVRRVLRLPSAPAVLSMHFFSYWYTKHKPKRPGPALFYNTGEDDLAVIAQYYDVPVLSLRNAAMHRMQGNEPGFRVDLWSPRDVPGTNLSDYFYWDDHHPYEHTGHRAMADLLVAAMQDAVREMVLLQGDAARADAGSPAAAAHAQQSMEVRQQQKRAQQQSELPDPMFPGNYESEQAVCKLGAAFQGAVVDHSGFEYRAQHPEAAEAASQKWAWVGTSPGAHAVLRVDTRLRRSSGDDGGSSGGSNGSGSSSGDSSGNSSGGQLDNSSSGGRIEDGSGAQGRSISGEADSQQGGLQVASDSGDSSKAGSGLARVYLGHTRSWRKVGTATVECVAGCACQPAVMDNNWRLKSTQAAMFTLEVTQHEECDIRVTVDPPASADVAPLTALTGVMVDGAGGADIDRKGNVGQWDMWE